jgi:hypothetical protein
MCGRAGRWSRRDAPGSQEVTTREVIDKINLYFTGRQCSAVQCNAQCSAVQCAL